jgi:hypothetical protein
MPEEEMKFFYKNNKKYSYIIIFSNYFVLRKVLETFNERN